MSFRPAPASCSARLRCVMLLGCINYNLGLGYVLTFL